MIPTVMQETVNVGDFREWRKTKKPRIQDSNKHRSRRSKLR
jgi:hypothetical protein